MFEIETDRVDAVTSAAFVGRTIIEDVTQMRTAVFAKDFSSVHAMAVVVTRADVFSDRRIGK